MDDFVHRENIEHYKKLLLHRTDPAERAVIVKLLAEETAKEPSLKPKGE